MKFKNELGVWYTQTVFLDNWPILPPSLLVRLSCLDEGCVEWWPKIEVTFQVLWLSIQLFGWTLVITVYINSAFHFNSALWVFFRRIITLLLFVMYVCGWPLHVTKDNLWESVLSTIWSSALKSGPQAWGWAVSQNEPFHLPLWFLQGVFIHYLIRSSNNGKGRQNRYYSQRKKLKPRNVLMA